MSALFYITQFEAAVVAGGEHQYCNVTSSRQKYCK